MGTIALLKKLFGLLSIYLNAIRSIELEVKHHEFPHPSGAANGAWRKLIGKSPTRENRINYWQQEVFAHLSGL
ncbi:hypothetical protein [Nostoc sp. PCC 9305]|uniref:hypothetical protein n=1 Tax=Nostoc sp. PCC 9305 TaxID=296636 RepID=UPI0039C65E19